MHIQNEIWRAEVVENDRVVRLYFKNKKSPITMNIKEFCALGAIIKQVEGAVK